MNVPAIADYISPIVAYRKWRWGSAGLKSVNGEPWHPGQALTAICFTPSHEAPARGCSCGVYAAKNHQHLLKVLNVEYEVHGEVYLWGRVAEHKLGYRAQFAYPRSLVLPSIIDPRSKPLGLESLIAYGVDISVVTHISRQAKQGLRVFEQSKKLLWTKESGYTPAGRDRVMQIEMRKQHWCEPEESQPPESDERIWSLFRDLRNMVNNRRK